MVRYSPKISQTFQAFTHTPEISQKRSPSLSNSSVGEPVHSAIGPHGRAWAISLATTPSGQTHCSLLFSWIKVSFSSSWKVNSGLHNVILRKPLLEQAIASNLSRKNMENSSKTDFLSIHRWPSPAAADAYCARTGHRRSRRKRKPRWS